MHVQGLRFETGPAIRNADHSLAQAFQILQPLVEAEVLHPVYAHFHSQESAELFVHTAHQVLAVDAQHVVAMVELFEHTMQFAAQPLGDAHPEDMSHFVGGQAEQSHFAGALQNLVDGEVPLADEVPAVLDWIDRVVSAQVDGLAFLLRELRTQQPTPVVQPFLEDRCAQLVSGRLQRFRVRSRQEGIVVLAKRHSLTAQFDVDEVVAVQVIRGLKGKGGGHAHGQRAAHRVAHVEIVMQEA